MKMWIKTLGTNDGYLRNAKIEFDEGLTCIIGARGTCKSTIVETLRFAHNLDPTKIQDLLQTDTSNLATQGPAGLLQASLESGTAACSIRTSDEHELRLERSITATRPRILRDGVLDTSDPISEIPIEIYSQGDLVKIAETPQHRLQLVDRPHAQKIAQIKTRLQTAQTEIQQLGSEILAHRSSLREEARALTQLSELEAQLETLQNERPMLDPRLEKERAEHEAREHFRASARITCDSFSKLFSRVRFEPPKDIAELRDALERTGIDQATQLAKEFTELSATAIGLEQQLANARTKLTRTETALRALDAAFDDRDQRYITLRRDQEAVSASLEREDRIRAQLRKMLQQRDARDRRQAQLDALLARRKELRETVEGCLEEVFELRLNEVMKITADIGDDLSLAIVQGAQSSVYTDAIVALLQGTRLKRQREIAARIAELLPPAELVDIVEREQAAELAKIANLDQSQASRITNHFLDNIADVFALETIAFDDQLEIEMNVDGEIRPIEKLSRGQMATALLPLILRHADFPLVFDQPEDDLDNRFIFDNLVAKIRELKRTRQLIFVTHNANIPVLGDADRIIVMAMENARLAAPARTGTVDEMRQWILDILEGGASAFRERRERYKDIL